MKTLRRILRQQRGSVMVIAASALVMILGFTALVTDLGILYTTRVQLTNLADAAVLAGVQELPANSASAYSVADIYARLNGQSGDAVNIKVPNGTTTAARVMRRVPLLFANIFGLSTWDVYGESAARIAPISGMSGTVPFGLVQQTLTYGQNYIIKFGSDIQEGSYKGNFGALALGGTGAKVYETNIINGYDGQINVGDWVSTETGNMVGPTSKGIKARYNQDPTATFSTVTKDSPRIMIVPVIQSIQVAGRNEVLVVGFAAMFLESNNVSNGTVTAKFMQMVTPGAISDGSGNFGLYGSRLIPFSSVN